MEAWLEVLCTAYGTCVPVLKLDPIEAQHELIGPDKTFSDFLGAFKCLNLLQCEGLGMPVHSWFPQRKQPEKMVRVQAL